MKMRFLFLLIFIIQLAACAPQNAASSSPVPVTTNTPLATVTPEPTQTLEPTPMSIPVNEISLESCTQILEAKISSAGALEVIYTNDNGFPLSIPFSKFGYSEWNTELWLWSDATQSVARFPVPTNVFGLKLSSDHRRIIFRRDSGENQSELWVIDANGQNEKKLATFFYNEVLARHPNFQYASLEYGWVPNMDKMFYGVSLNDGADYGLSPYDNFVVVDIPSGKATSMNIPSELDKFEFAPDGSQMAFLSGSELRVLSTQNGKTQFTIQASLNEPTYSPDGKYIIDFIDGGILRIDAKDGQQQIIPLKYTIMSSRTEGPSYGPLPDFRWIDNSTLIMSSLNSDKRYVSALLPPDPKWTFTIFQVDIANGTTQTIQSFDGSPLSSFFSPNNKRLAFWKYDGILPDQKRNLYIADVVSGEILEIIETGEFRGWFPDSERYLYATGITYPPPGKGDPGSTEVKVKYYLGQVGEVEIKYYLGQIGKKSVPINWDSRALAGLRYAQWVDKNRIVADCKIMRVP